MINIKFLLVLAIVFILTACSSVPKRDSLSIVDAPIPLVVIEPKLKKSEELLSKQAVVRLDFIISPKGKVIEPNIIQVEGSDYFTAPLINAFKLWRFKPLVKNGKSQFSQSQIAFIFTTDSKEREAFIAENKNQHFFISIKGYNR